MTENEIAKKGASPDYERKLGSVRIAVWAKRTDQGRQLHNVKLARQYTDKEGNWHEAPTYNGVADLVHAEELIRSAKGWIEAHGA